MLKGKELEMYKAENRNVRIKCIDGDIIEGYCSEFSDAYDNDEPELASITIKNGIMNNTKKLYPLTEIYENEIETLEYID